MTDKVTEVRVIKDPFELLDWVMERAIRAEPQVPTAHAFIEVLQKLIAEVHEHGFLPEQGDPGEYMQEVLESLSKPSEAVTANVELVNLVTDLLGDVLFRERQHELYELVEKLAEVALLESRIPYEPVKDKVRFTSAPDLVQTHGVWIDVLVARHLLEGNPCRPIDLRTPF